MIFTEKTHLRDVKDVYAYNTECIYILVTRSRHTSNTPVLWQAANAHATTSALKS